jgi:hypothetical protein
MGAQCDPVGFMDVVHHPTSTYAGLNYVTPRRHTAWVSSKQVEAGLDKLREFGRRARIRFAEGLYPPVFIKALRELGLQVEEEIPMMVYRSNPKKAFRLPRLPENVAYKVAADQDGIALWWYVWRNAFYDVMTSGMEPIYVGKDMRDVTLGEQIDIILYQHGQAVGVSRVSLYENTGHIQSQALMKEVRTPELARVLLAAALKEALDKGCEMVFTSGERGESRDLCRKLGFVDAGSVVTYAEASKDQAHQEEAHGTLEESVLIL